MLTCAPWYACRRVDAADVAAGGEEPSDEQPDFLPMFHWFTGTSADMYRTIAGLIISVKVFLGRFDMRTMQARPTPSL